jgi:hypothetical protein
MGVWSVVAVHPYLVKTTLDIDDDLLRRAKQAALDRDTTLRAIVEEALVRALGQASAPTPIRTVVWPPPASDGTSRVPDDTTDWMAEIKRVRYGADAADDGDVEVGPRAARASKRRRR